MTDDSLERKRAYQREWKRKWRATNPDATAKETEAKRKWIEKNPEQWKESSRKRTATYREKHSKTPKYLYAAHRQNALARDIPFLLTFEEWTEIWATSGKWEERGWRRGQYCMARHGDLGAYEVGNVSIVLAEDNRAERNRNYPMCGEANPAFGKNYRAK